MWLHPEAVDLGDRSGNRGGQDDSGSFQGPACFELAEREVGSASNYHSTPLYNVRKRTGVWYSQSALALAEPFCSGQFNDYRVICCCKNHFEKSASCYH